MYLYIDRSSLEWITIPSELELQLESKIQSKVSKVGKLLEYSIFHNFFSDETHLLSMFYAGNYPVPGVKTVKRTRQKVFILLCLCVCISGMLTLASTISKHVLHLN